MNEKTSISDLLFSDSAVLFLLISAAALSAVWATALDVELIWMAKTGAAVSNAPLIIDDRVYVTSADKRLYCLDVDDGKEIWNTRFKQRLYYAPLFYDGRIFVGESFSTGELRALDAEGGEKIWSVVIGKGVLKPVILNDVIISGAGNRIVALRPENGSTVNRISADESVTSLHSWNGYLIAVGNSGDILFYSSELELVTSLFMGPGGVFLYPADGSLYGVVSTGSLFKINDRLEIEWKTDDGRPSFRHPIAAGEYVYSIANGGTVSVFIEDTGELINEIIIGDNVFSYIGFTGGIIVFSEFGTVFYVSDTASYRTDLPLSGHKFISPISSRNEDIYISDSSGILYRFKVII
ncbi:MAG: PQQ-binding-like beta-propeller repeat protein [bacterium]|nr:PQQ-binding-like beta-propeller repeat protein [bacterium]